MVISQDDYTGVAESNSPLDYFEHVRVHGALGYFFAVSGVDNFPLPVLAVINVDSDDAAGLQIGRNSDSALLVGVRRFDGNGCAGEKRGTSLYDFRIYYSGKKNIC